MEYGSWLKWQIDYLLWFQNFRDVSNHIFDKFFIYITMFGEITIPIIVICLFYWVLNKKTGQFMLFSWIMGFIINLFLKALACIYRPWILDCRIHPVPEAIPAATGYSFPSGHTAGAMAIWGSLAVSFWKNKLVRFLGIFIVLCVMVSRNYLGVHTPQDVIVSFIVSCFVLWGVYSLLNWVDSDETKKNRDLILVGGIFLVSVLVLAYILFKPYPVHYLFGKVLYYPHEMKYDSLLRSGLLFGAFIGWLLERRYINFLPETGTILKKVIRFGFGIACLSAMYSVIKILKSIPGMELCAFIQFFILGMFITCIYPFIIKKFQI